MKLPLLSPAAPRGRVWPVPSVVKRFLEDFDEQSLAEAARAGQEVVLASVVHGPARVAGLVDIVEVSWICDRVMSAPDAHGCY